MRTVGKITKTQSPEEFLLEQMRKILKNYGVQIVEQTRYTLTVVDPKNQRSERIKHLLEDFPDLKPSRFEARTGNPRDVIVNDMITIKFKNKDTYLSKSFRGTKRTISTESIQCWYLALFNYTDKKNIDIEVLPILKQYVDTPLITESDVLSFIEDPLNKSWIRVFKNTARVLIKQFKQREGLTFHRASEDINQIFSAFKQVNSVFRKFDNINKWSPADIYIFGPNYKESIEKLSEAQNFTELNSLMKDFFLQGTIVGVSLKKTNSPKINTYNLGNLVVEKLFYRYVGSKIITSENIFKSKSCYLYGQQKGKKKIYTIELRNDRDAIGHWMGELVGVVAMDGKIGGTLINKRVLRKYVLPSLLIPVNSYAQILKKSVPEAIKQFLSLCEKMNVNITLDDMIQFIRTYPPTNRSYPSGFVYWLYSKYLGMYFIYILEKVSSQTKDSIITDLINYSRAITPDSIPFLKTEVN